MTGAKASGRRKFLPRMAIPCSGRSPHPPNRDILRMGVPQITIVYLRNRAAHYRQLMAKTCDPRRANRYREFSELLESRSTEGSEPQAD
jgi:hypothetical protein